MHTPYAKRTNACVSGDRCGQKCGLRKRSGIDAAPDPAPVPRDRVVGALADEAPPGQVERGDGPPGEGRRPEDPPERVEAPVDATVRVDRVHRIVEVGVAELREPSENLVPGARVVEGEPPAAIERANDAETANAE